MTKLSNQPIISASADNFWQLGCQAAPLFARLVDNHDSGNIFKTRLKSAVTVLFSLKANRSKITVKIYSIGWIFYQPRSLFFMDFQKILI